MSKYKIADLCDVTSSKRIYASEYQKEGVPFYRGKEIIEKSENKDVRTELYISNDKYLQCLKKYGVPQKNDILMTAVGTLGVTYLVKTEKFYFKDGNIIWFKNFIPSILSQYLYYYFKSQMFKNKISEISIGSTQKAITIDSLKNIYLEIAPIEFQKHIVDIIVCL